MWAPAVIFVIIEAKNRSLIAGDALSTPIPIAEITTSKLVMYIAIAMQVPNIDFDFFADVVMKPVIFRNNQVKASTPMNTVGTQHGHTDRFKSTMALQSLMNMNI
jgi:hypothetical protein